jgi:hypothetical protein
MQYAREFVVVDIVAIGVPCNTSYSFSDILAQEGNCNISDGMGQNISLWISYIWCVF